jgi:hypothetical protein
MLFSECSAQVAASSPKVITSPEPYSKDKHGLVCHHNGQQQTALPSRSKPVAHQGQEAPMVKTVALRKEEQTRFANKVDFHYPESRSSDSETGIGKVSISTENAQLPDWDGWPAGSWSHLYTFSEFEALSNLSVHWATRVLGGDKKGDSNSATPSGGKITRQKCLGIIHCQNPDCSGVICTQTHPAGIHKQLSQQCQCGWTLSHKECGVESSLCHYQAGILYSTQGDHNHQRPTHILHLSRDEKSQFQEILQNHPKSGALQLVVGVPGLDGPGKSGADISPVLLNADRVHMKKKKMKSTLNLVGVKDVERRLYSEFMGALRRSGV